MFKGVCVNDFNGGNHSVLTATITSVPVPGRTLSALGSAQIQIDPDVVVAHDLRRWYLEQGMNVEMTDVSTRSAHHEPSKTHSFSLMTLLRID